MNSPRHSFRSTYFGFILLLLLLLPAHAALAQGVRSWGSNTSGQLGTTAVPYSSSLPVEANSLGAGVVAVSCGMNHSLALMSDGTVRAWGFNASGQLGDGTTINRTNPIVVPGLSTVIAVSAGSEHSLALLSNGTVRSWGKNTYGQLGDGTTTNRLSPITINLLNNVTAISGGGNHSLALTSFGTVAAWGFNVSGQIGDGTTTTRLAPVMVSGLTNVTAIAAGNSHNLALVAGGGIRAWGDNLFGEIGDGTTATRLTPVSVSLSVPPGAVAIDAGWGDSFALMSDGTMRAWGKNEYGELGDGTNTNRALPIVVPGMNGVAEVAAGFYHTVVRKHDGTLRAWGMNGIGQLGTGVAGQLVNPTPASVLNMSGVSMIAAGRYHTIAIRASAPSCSADIAPPGGNGVINMDDLLMIINGWGACP